MPAPKLGILPLARPTFDIPFAAELVNRQMAALGALPLDVLGSADLIMDAEAASEAIAALQSQKPELLLVLQASFADSTLVMQIAEAFDLPLVLWAYPEDRTGGRLRLNSFCGINLAGHALTRAKHRYDYIYAAPDDAAALQKLTVLAKAAQVKRVLSGATIARVGEHPDGFETCIPHQADIKRKFGAKIEQIDLATVFEAVRQTPPENTQPVYDRLKARLDNLGEMDAAATHNTLATYTTLHHMAAEKAYAGFAVRCWGQFFEELGAAACGASSLLNDEMTPSACETDVNGALTQIMLQAVADEPVFGTDMVDFNADDDTAIVWHCGKAPLSMCDPAYTPQAALHSNRQKPLLLQFPLKPGRVTIARLSEARGEFTLVIGGGQMLSAPPAFTGTSGTLRFDIGTQAALDRIMDYGLEHHIALAYGDHLPVLRALGKMLNIPVIEL